LNDGLLPQFAGIFGLKGIELAIGPAVSTAVLFLGAIPAALSARSFGTKGSILLGPAVFCVGTFLIHPAMQSRSFQLFLWAAAVMACG
jgi:fucose permease